MIERTFGLEIEEAYAKLRPLLLKKNCRIINENAPTSISVRQGSLWGISPVTAKKNMNFNLNAIDDKTQIGCSSSLSTDWKNLTIIGSALAIIVVLLFLNISMDLDALITTRQESYWSWIALVNGQVNFDIAQMLANLTRILAFFLAIVLAAEVATVTYVKFKINTFAEETLNALTRETPK